MDPVVSAARRSAVDHLVFSLQPIQLDLQPSDLFVEPRPRVLSSSVGAWQTWSMKRDVPNYGGYRFPPEIISHAVWLYHRFGVSFRDVEDLLAQRGLTVSYEAIPYGATKRPRLANRRNKVGASGCSSSSLRECPTLCASSYSRPLAG